MGGSALLLPAKLLASHRPALFDYGYTTLCSSVVEALPHQSSQETSNDCFQIVAIPTRGGYTLSVGFRMMIAGRHLILQELALTPSAEWHPDCNGWLMARAAEGSGYWLPQNGNPRQLSAGDGLIVIHHADGIVRASSLGPLKFQFFTVHLEYLNGLLTVAEWQQLEVAPNQPMPSVSFFTASEPLGQKFMRLAEQSGNHRLPMRCALLQLWASAVANLLQVDRHSSTGSNKLRDHFRDMIGQMTEAELAEHSMSELARQLHCSERHFSRLFRKEFGVPFHARQIELRLQRARHLLADADAKLINVAHISGYRHLSLFNASFKKRFGLTPVEWRKRNLHKNPSPTEENPLSRCRTITSLAILAFWVLHPLASNSL